jgi:hypothetical protein
MNLETLLADPQVSLLGFQPSPIPESEGAYLFNHHACGSTMALLEKVVGRLELA